MEDLVNALKNEHLQIIDALNYVNKMGIYSAEGQRKLLESKTLLLSHLQKEDHSLYPELKDEATKNASVKSTLQSFAKELESISSYALEFYSKYQNGGQGLEFAKDFGRLFALLQTRIGREERILYPIYNQIKRK